MLGIRFAQNHSNKVRKRAYCMPGSKSTREREMTVVMLYVLAFSWTFFANILDLTLMAYLTASFSAIFILVFVTVVMVLLLFLFLMTNRQAKNLFTFQEHRHNMWFFLDYVSLAAFASFTGLFINYIVIFVIGFEGDFVYTLILNALGFAGTFVLVLLFARR